jgi:hypothetical protein
VLLVAMHTLYGGKALFVLLLMNGSSLEEKNHIM